MPSSVVGYVFAADQPAIGDPIPPASRGTLLDAPRFFIRSLERTDESWWRFDAQEK
jgi:hypothetical protein